MSKISLPAIALFAQFAILANPSIAQDAARKESGSIEVHSAFIVAAQQTIVAARDTGTLVQFDVRPGDSVKSTQRIGSLDSEETRLLLARAELDLKIAVNAANDKLSVESAERLLNESRQLKTQAELSRQIAKLRSDSDVAVRSAMVKASSAKAELDRARRSRERHKASVSQTEVDRLQSAYQKAELEVDKARQDSQVAVLQQQLQDATLTERKEGVLRQEAAVGQAKNDQAMAFLLKQQRELAVAMAKEMHQRREMISSIDGEIAQTYVEEGQWVKTGDKIARIVNLQKLHVEGYVAANYPRRRLKTATATIEFNDGNKRTQIPGRVVFVSPEVDRANRQFTIRIEFDNRPYGLTPGVAAFATLKLSTGKTSAGE